MIIVRSVNVVNITLECVSTIREDANKGIDVAINKDVMLAIAAPNSFFANKYIKIILKNPKMKLNM